MLKAMVINQITFIKEEIILASDYKSYDLNEV
jgi:hypothetical protein